MTGSSSPETRTVLHPVVELGSVEAVLGALLGLLLRR